MRIAPYARLGIAAYVLLTGAAIAGEVLEATVRDISGTNYLPVVRRELAAATGSVVVAMYHLRVPSGSTPQNPARILVGDLIDAHRRGVEVTVVLDRSFRSNANHEDRALSTANDTAADMLLYAGVPVRFGPADQVMHQKLVIIDAATVITGSRNWSWSAIHLNREDSLLVHCPAYARLKLASIHGLATTAPPPRDVTHTVAVPDAFLADIRQAPRMVSRHDARAFDVYLLLLRALQQTHGAQPAGFSVDLTQLAADLGMDMSVGATAYRRQLIKTLRKLADDYGLIEVEIPFSRPATVQMPLDLKPGADTLNIPFAYWTYGPATELGFAAKLAYLVCHAEQARAATPPQWSLSIAALARKYAVSAATFVTGLNELERLDLLDVTRTSAGEGGALDKRAPNTYRLKPLLSPAQREAHWAELTRTHGQQTTEQARQLAALLDCDRNIAAVAQLARTIEKYGYAPTHQATSRVSRMARHNPWRNPFAVIGLLDPPSPAIEHRNQPGSKE